MSRRFAVLSVSAVLLFSGVLTACNNDDDRGDPAPSETTTSAAAASSAPAQDEYVPASSEGPAKNVPTPTKPALADEESVEGAQAFLDYLSDARAYAQQTGDTSLAREVTAEECYSCTEHYDNLDSHYEAGGWASEGYEKFTILSEDLPVDSYGLYAPEISIEADDITIWDDKGQVVQEARGEDGSEDRILVHLDYREGQWTYVTTAPLGSS
ncbi:hypothetical protein GWK18_04410 [Kocuria sp. JC486]|uniref:DUF6318 family protein n=1 Tax=Kocuria sp. JC486 TaxID=1970736 RepID=UPI00141FF2DA|nr:DUF6318 family protein [Kocuria sp. JC486]NHU84842.1 hypothetical protein [Kocuria sp. JC486]